MLEADTASDWGYECGGQARGDADAGDGGDGGEGIRTNYEN